MSSLCSLALLLALSLALACGGDKNAAPARADTRVQHGAARKVKVTRAHTFSLSETVKATGTLAAEERVVVSAKVPGRLASIGVDLGSPVRRGQTIGQIETTDYRLRVVQAEAALGQVRALLGLPPSGKESEVDVEQMTGVRQARATFIEATKNRERSQALLDRKLIGRADFDAVDANFARADSAVAAAQAEVYNRLALLRQRQSELLIARQALTDSTLVSPLDGVVQVRHASAGELLAAGAAVATLVRIDPLRLRLEIPDHAAAGVAVGQEVRVMPPDGASYPGKIARIAPAIDDQNRTLTVEAEVPNPGVLRPGSFVRAEVQLGARDNAVGIPTRSIVVFAGIEKVIAVKDGKALEVVISTGRRAGEMTEVKSGIEDGTEVVLEPGNLQTGDSVEVSVAEDPSRAEAG